MDMKSEKPNKTARAELDRSAIDAVVTLFLLRDGLLLPQEIDSVTGDTREHDAMRALLLYAELSGLIVQGTDMDRVHARISEV